MDASVSSVVGGGSQTEQPRTQEAPIPSGIGATEDDGMRCVCGPPGTPLSLRTRPLNDGREEPEALEALADREGLVLVGVDERQP